MRKVIKKIEELNNKIKKTKRDLEVNGRKW